MKQFIIAQSKKEFYTSHSGLALVGLCLNKLCSLPAKAMDAFPRKVGGIGLDDILRSYVGLLTMGKSDFEAITDCRDDDHFSQSLGVARVPSAETLRQRLDEVAPTLRRYCRCLLGGIPEKGPGDHLLLWIQDISPWTAMSFRWTTPRPKRKGCPVSTTGRTGMRPWRRTWARRVGAWSWSCVKEANTAKMDSFLFLSGSSRRPAALLPEKSLCALTRPTMRLIPVLPWRAKRMSATSSSGIPEGKTSSNGRGGFSRKARSLLPGTGKELGCSPSISSRSTREDLQVQKGYAGSRAHH